jgi:hypothetical protein
VVISSTNYKKITIIYTIFRVTDSIFRYRQFHFNKYTYCRTKATFVSKCNRDRWFWTNWIHNLLRSAIRENYCLGRQRDLSATWRCMRLVVLAVGRRYWNCGPLGRDVNIVLDFNIITALLLRRISHISDFNFVQFWFIIHSYIKSNEFGQCKFS